MGQKNTLSKRTSVRHPQINYLIIWFESSSASFAMFSTRPLQQKYWQVVANCSDFWKVSGIHYEIWKVTKQISFEKSKSGQNIQKFNFFFPLFFSQTNFYQHGFLLLYNKIHKHHIYLLVKITIFFWGFKPTFKKDGIHFFFVFCFFFSEGVREELLKEFAQKMF